MFKGIFQKGVYGWLPLNGFSKAFKRSLVISTAGLGVIFTAGLGVIFTAGRVVTFTAGLGIVQVVWFHARVHVGSVCGENGTRATICYGLPCPNGPIWDGLGIECHRTRENWTT